MYKGNQDGLQYVFESSSENQMIYKLLKRFSIHRETRWSVSSNGVTLIFDLTRYCRFYAMLNTGYPSWAIEMWYDAGYRRIFYDSITGCGMDIMNRLVEKKLPIVACVSNAREILQMITSWYQKQSKKCDEAYKQLYQGPIYPGA